MKNSNSFRRGVFGLAVAGLAGAAIFTPASPAQAFYSSDDVSEERSVAAFTKILIKGGIELDLTAGKDQKLVVETEEGYLERVLTFVDGDTLVIDMEDKRRRKFWNDVDVDITIQMPTLEGIEVRGAVDGDVRNLDADKLMVEIKGAADLNLEGNCETLTLDIKGAGDIGADDLKCKVVDVDVKGAGSASVYASDEVEANVRGVGSIDVYGKPKTIRKKVGGIGSISIR
jgi:hypothetical protein